MRRLHHTEAGFAASVRELVHRVSGLPAQVETAARDIVDDVRRRGDEAVRELTLRFEKRSLAAFELPRSEWAGASAGVNPTVMRALESAASRIRAFAEHERATLRGHEMREPGIRLASRLTPLARVGLYVPGGTALYPSTVLMTAIPAKVAGVPELVMTTPGPSPEALAAAVLAGVDRVFVLGGAQAVAAMAFGTESVPRVDKIVGPGNAYVAAAKKIVFGDVGVDAIAGPTELVVVADATADPRFVAADLLAQAEHDALAVPILIAVGEGVVEPILREIAAQVETLPRRDIAKRALADRGAAIVVADLEAAIAIANELAPEHAELFVAGAREAAEALHNAGAIFVGAFTPEPVGDYFAGPSHVLPTSGSARFASPLGVADFLKRTSVIEYEPVALLAQADAIEAFARAEGLDAHARSVAVRREAAASQDNRAGMEPRPYTDQIISLTRPGLRGAPGYEVPVPAGIRVRLDANENPFSPPADVMADLAEVVATAALHRYPDPASADLRAALGKRTGVAAERLVLGNGADELIGVLCATFGEPRPGAARPLFAYPAPSFAMYRFYALGSGGEPLPIALRPDFSLDEDAIARVCSERRPNIVFLARPNNPTGNLWPRAAVQRLARLLPDTLVVSDEAYIDYAERPDETALGDVDALPNVIVLRTLSKIGLAGLRLGFAVAHPNLVHHIDKVRGPYNVNLLTQRVGLRIVERHWDALHGSIARVITERSRLLAALGRRTDIEVFPTAANFVLVRVRQAGTGQALWHKLAEKSVLVRGFGDQGPLAGCLRITVGAPDENAALLAALEQV